MSTEIETRTRELRALPLPDHVVPARVAVRSRDRLVVLHGDDEVPATLPGRLHHEAADPSELPAVGDWVALDPESGAVHLRLERRTVLRRAGAGESSVPQVLAANVDTAFLFDAADQQPNPHRLERFVALSRDGGVEPVVLLSKDDLTTSDTPAREGIPGVPAVQISARTEANLEALAPWLRPGRTVALIGPSGAGKSTLANVLLGEERLATSAVRGADGEGRHTTTRRELVALPQGAWLVDTPGLRSVGLWAGADPAAGESDPVEELARLCRFPDCGHHGEPGCAVAAAIESGELDAEQLEHHLQLEREKRWMAERAAGRGRRNRRRREARATAEFDERVRIKRAHKH